MTSEPSLEWMNAALDGDLPAEQQAALDQQLAASREKQALWEALRNVDRALSAAPLVPPAGGFEARVRARLAGRRSRARAFGGLFLLGLAAAGGMALGLSIGMSWIVSAARAALQPATLAALLSGLSAAAATGRTILDALWISADVLGQWAVSYPYAWFAAIGCIAAAVAWLVWMRKLAPEVYVL